MLKLTFCLHRLPSLSCDAFQSYWREQHAPLVKTHAETLGIVRYVQSHAETHDMNGVIRKSRGTPEMYDGVAEIFYESWDSITATAANPGYREAAFALLEDEKKFIDLNRSPLWWNQEHVIIG